jgi:hypothetical protein
MLSPPSTINNCFFTFDIPYSSYTNDDDNNGNKPLTMNRTFEFSNGIHVEKIWELIQVGILELMTQ